MPAPAIPRGAHPQDLGHRCAAQIGEGGDNSVPRARRAARGRDFDEMADGPALLTQPCPQSCRLPPPDSRLLQTPGGRELIGEIV